MSVEIRSEIILGFFLGIVQQLLSKLFQQFFLGFLSMVSLEIYSRIPLGDPSIILQGTPFAILLRFPLKLYQNFF